MSTGLVGARIQVEGDHQSTAVVGRADVLSTVVVRNVAVEELGGDRLVKRHTVSSDADLIEGLDAVIHGQGAVVDGTEHGKRSSGGSRSKVHGATVVSLRRSLVVTPPLTEVTVVLSNTVERIGGNTTRSAVSRGRAVSQETISLGEIRGRAKTNEEGLNRPLKLLELDRHGAAAATGVHGGNLATMHANERESNALDEDIVNLRVDENVVDVKVAHTDKRRRQAGGGVSTTVHNAHNVILASELNVDETLSIRDGHGRHRKAGILVEPEQKRDEHVHVVVHKLGSLGTVNDGHLATMGLALSRGTHDLTSAGHLLSDVAKPANLLVRLHGELVMEVVHVTRVLIQGVAVNLNVDLLDQAVTKVVGEAVVILILTSCRSSKLRKHGGIQTNMEHHIVEEITELRDGELHRLVEGSLSTAADLVVLITDRGERLEVSVHEQNVRALNVDESRRGVKTLRITLLLDVLDTSTKELGRHQHAVLLAIIRDKNEDTTCGHFGVLFDFTKIRKYESKYDNAVIDHSIISYRKNFVK